jgi:hypothetical protein
VRGLTGSVVFVCVLWYRDMSSEGLTGSVVFVCVCVMVQKCEQ